MEHLDSVESTSRQHTDESKNVRGSTSEEECQAKEILSCFLRNCFSASASKDILHTMKKLFQKDGICIPNYDQIWKGINPGKGFKEVHYCIKCHAVFPGDIEEFECDTNECDGLRYKGSIASQRNSGRQPKQFFLLADIETQLQCFLSSPGKENKNFAYKLLYVREHTVC